MTEFIQRNKAGVLLVAYLAFAVSCLTLKVGPYVGGTKTILWYLLSPEVVYSGEFFNKLDSLRGRIFQLFRVEGENYILRQQIADLSKRDIERDALEDENNRLRRILNLKEKQYSEAIAAEVVARDPRDWFHSIVINAGRNQGVVESAAVIAIVSGQPMLVGRIMEVSESTSKVLLITDAVSAVSVTVPGKNDVGLLEGRNKPWLLLNYLSPQSIVAVGDDIVTVGLGGVFPPGVPVGAVAQVKVTQDGYFKTAQVVPLGGLNSLREVLVLERN